METCKTCPFFVPNGPGALAQDKAESDDGACHFGPPQVSVVLTVQQVGLTQAEALANPAAPPSRMAQIPATITAWPAVTGSRDWCGEHPAFAGEDETGTEIEA